MQYAIDRSSHFAIVWVVGWGGKSMANHIDSYISIKQKVALERLLHIISRHLTYSDQNHAIER